jgi:hypothetical protein
MMGGTMSYRWTEEEVKLQIRKRGIQLEKTQKFFQTKMNLGK